MRKTIIAGLLAPFVLTGCSLLGGGKTPAALLTLTATERRAPEQPRTAAEGRVITVVTPVAAQALRNRRVPVYVNDTTIQYLQNATWVANPNELVRQLVSETVAARTNLTIVDPNSYTQVQGMTLSGELIQFGLDPNRMEAVAVLEAALASPNQAVTTNRFEARVPVSQPTAAAVAPALNQAANQVAQQVAAWVG